MKHFTPIFIAFASMATACKKTDNGDVADQYVGLYDFTDTVTVISQGDTIIGYPTNTGAIIKQSANTVSLYNFSEFACDTVAAQVTETVLMLTGSGSCASGSVDFPANFTARKQGNTIYYQYTKNTTPASQETIRGKAVKL